MKLFVFVVTFIVMWFIAWMITGVVFGFGFNLGGRFSWQLLPVVLIISAVGAVAYRFLPNPSWWKVAGVCLLAALAFDVRYHLAVQELVPLRLLVTAWETLLPSAAAFLLAQQTPSTFGKPKGKPYY
jgi:hypothetical protein